MSQTVVLLPRDALYVWTPKSQADTVMRAVDWSARLANGDAIVSSTFELPVGLTSPKASNDGKVASVWISGGAEQVYEVVNRVKTAAGAELEQAIRLRVKAR